MKVYWGEIQKTDSWGTLQDVRERKLLPSEKEYHLLTNEELEEIKKQAIADYEKARWVNVIKVVKEQVFYNGAEDQSIAPNSEITSSAK